MQIRGLHRAIYRGARLAFRRDGLSVKAAAAKVPLSTLYRWQKGCERKSTRSHTVRKPKRDRRLAIAVERLRRKFPMGGKDKLAPLLWREGFDASVSMVGRILKSLVDRGAVEAVPNLRRRSKHAPRRHKRVHAKRLPKNMKAEKPGQIVQLDAVHISLLPGKTIRHFTGYCPVAKWTVGKAYNRATAASAKLFDAAAT